MQLETVGCLTLRYQEKMQMRKKRQRTGEQRSTERNTRATKHAVSAVANIHNAELSLVVKQARDAPYNNIVSRHVVNNVYRLNKFDSGTND
jgi:hypothetical protein